MGEHTKDRKHVVDGVSMTAEQINAAMLVAQEIALLGSGKCIISPKLANIARAAVATVKP